MRHIYTARDEMDAHFVRGLLEQQGVRAVVQGEALEAGALGTLPLSAQAKPSVWVDDPDEARAAEVVAEYRRVDEANAGDDDGTQSARMTWTCGNCGERVEEQFDRCWKCGHNRPAQDDPHVTGPH